MRITSRWAIIALLSSVGAITSSAGAQDTSSPEVFVQINESIYHSRQGDRTGYEKAIELLSSALEEQPDNEYAISNMKRIQEIRNKEMFKE